MTGICHNKICLMSKKAMSSTAIDKKNHFSYIIIKSKNKFILFLAALVPLFFEGNDRTARILAAVLLQLLILSAVLIPAVISHHNIRWTCNEKYIYYMSGVFFKKEIALPITHINSASVSKTPILTIFGASRLQLRSADGGKKPEITLYLKHEEAASLLVKLMHPAKPLKTLIPRTSSFLLLSAAKSNFAVGLSFIIIFFISLGKAFDENLTAKLYVGLSDAAHAFIPYIPPIIAIVAAFFFLGWMAHFLKICFSEARQITSVSPDCITIVSGLVSTHLTCIRKQYVSACSAKETIISSLFRQNCVSISYYGQKRKSTVSALTAWHSSDFSNAAYDLMHIEKKSDISVKIADNASLILWLPYAVFAVITAFAWFITYMRSPAMLSVFSYAAATILFLLIWKCLAGIIGACKARLDFSGQHISISTIRGFSFYTQNIFLGKIASFKIRQSIIQRPRNLCTVYIKAAGSSRGLTCVNLPHDIIRSLSERIK